MFFHDRFPLHPSVTIGGPHLDFVDPGTDAEDIRQTPSSPIGLSTSL
jgi:hypothetical protein